jgi:hypothetical protein
MNNPGNLLLKGDTVYVLTDAALAHMKPATIKAPPEMQGFVCIETADGIEWSGS